MICVVSMVDIRIYFSKIPIAVSIRLEATYDLRLSLVHSSAKDRGRELLSLLPQIIQHHEFIIPFIKHTPGSGVVQELT